jgi:hypothetical protein
VGAALTLRASARHRWSDTAPALTEREQKARQRSEALARQLAVEARRDGDAWVLSPATLYELAKSGGFSVVAFHTTDQLLALPLPQLHRVLRACKSARILDVRVSRANVMLAYDTTGSRGRLSLALHRLDHDQDVVVVDLVAQLAPVRLVPQYVPTTGALPAEVKTERHAPVVPTHLSCRAASRSISSTVRASCSASGPPPATLNASTSAR